MEMEKKVNKSLDVTEDESEAVSRLVVPVIPPGGVSFYDAFVVRGIRVNRVEPGLIVCTLKVPPRFTVMLLCARYVVLRASPREEKLLWHGDARDRGGNLANGAIANLVDELGFCAAYVPGQPMNVSVDISISYMSTAKLHDELEITSRLLGRIGRYYGVIVILRNKTTGEIIAEGRQSFFSSRPIAKL